MRVRKKKLLLRDDSEGLGVAVSRTSDVDLDGSIRDVPLEVVQTRHGGAGFPGWVAALFEEGS